MSCRALKHAFHDESGGKERAALAAVWFAAGGGLAHQAGDSINARGGVRGTLAHYGFLDAPEDLGDQSPCGTLMSQTVCDVGKQQWQDCCMHLHT